MDAEKVIKALECCLIGEVAFCDKCPVENCIDCQRELLNQTIDLIKRQQAEIERLQEIANPKCQQCVEQTRKNSFVEFAERLKEIYVIHEGLHIEIDNLVKELTEVSNGID